MSHDWFSVSQEGATHVLALTVPAQVDSADFDRLHELVLAAVAEHAAGRWVLDLARLQYVGSSVLGLMVNIRQRVTQSGGKLALCGMAPKLLQVFRTCSLERLFVIKPHRDEAVGAVGR